MEVLETVKRQELVEKFAEHIAYSQELADKNYYVLEDHEESDYITHKITALKEMAAILGIYKEVSAKAKEFYDSDENGKSRYFPSKERLEELKNFYYILPLEEEM